MPALAPVQAGGETISKAGGASVKMNLRNGKKCHRGRAGGNENSEKQQREPLGQRREGEEEEEGKKKGK